MPRYSKKRTKKVIDSYNAAIRRAQKSTKLTALEKSRIPQKVNFKTLAQFTNAKDRDRFLDYLQQVKGGLKQFKLQEINKGVFASKFELQVAQKQINFVNRDRAKRRRELKQYDPNSPDFKRIRFDPTTYTQQSDLDKRLARLQEQSRADYIEEQQAEFMGRYLKSLITAFGDAGSLMVDDILAQGLTAPEMYDRLVNMDIVDIPYVYGAAKSGNAVRFLGDLAEAFELDEMENYFEE